MSTWFCSKTKADCARKAAEQQALIDRFRNHDSTVYGLPNLKDPNNALKLTCSDVQHIWNVIGIDYKHQHMMGRSWYAPKYLDICKFLSRCISHMLHPVTGEFDCNDYSDVMLGERLSLGLYGSTQLEWYMAIIGRIKGQYVPERGEISHAWNWFVCMERPKDVFFVDYFKPKGPSWKITNITYVSLYTPETHGPLVNCDVYW
jgi:hypothetical protein